MARSMKRVSGAAWVGLVFCGLTLTWAPAQQDETRSFRMGFTPWPFAFSDDAIDFTYDAIQEHADLLVHHLDSGVPWPEALAGGPYPPAVMDQLEQRKSRAADMPTLYVSATPQSQDRATLAKYWGSDEHQDLPEAWAHKTFDDPDVIQAYLNYCNFLIEFLEPDYFAYGIEVNGGLRTDHANFGPFKILAAQVYSALKEKHSDLPVFLTFQTGSFEATWEQQMDVNRALIEYSDWVGMSTYPFWAPGRFQPEDADMSYLPRDWFDQMALIAPDKPFAITETGFVAEPLELASIGVRIRGREDWQARYVDYLLTHANRLEAEFIVWFVLRDYDEGWEVMRQLGFPDWVTIWKDTGLLDGDGQPRTGLESWDRWLNRSIRD